MNLARGLPTTVDAGQREKAATVAVYSQLPFVAESGSGCEIITADGRRILDYYGGHAVAALGYGHPRLTQAIREQAERLLFQSNAVALAVRASAAEALLSIAPSNISRVFLVNSGAEANENALRIACMATGRKKVLAITHGFHGRTAAAASVTWKSAERWYGFPYRPFDVEFIPRNEVSAAQSLIDRDVAAVIFEPVQGVAGAFDLSLEFVAALRQATQACGAALIADEVQCGMGRSGQYFAVQAYGVQPDMITLAKALGGGVPCSALLIDDSLCTAIRPGDLGTTFGGSPLAAAAIAAVIETIREERLLENVQAREAEIRALCVAGPVRSVQGKGLMLGLACTRPASQVQAALLEHDILAGTSADPDVLRLLPPLVLQSQHVQRLSSALAKIGAGT